MYPCTSLVIMLKRIVCVICWSLVLKGLAYPVNSDSLSAMLDTVTSDVSRIGTLLVMSDQSVYDDPNRAIDLANQALSISNELENPTLIAISQHRLGKAYGLKGDLLKSLLYITESLQVAESIGDRKLMAHNLGDLGNVYWMAGDFIHAVDYYLRALTFFEEQLDVDRTFAMYNNIGRVYLDGEELDSAGKYLGIATQKMDDEIVHLKPVLLDNLSELAFKLNDYEASYSLAQTCMEACHEVDDSRTLALAFRRLAEIELIRGNQEEALKLAKTAYDLSVDVDAFKFIFKSAKTLSNVYFAVSDTENAYKFLQVALSYEDSLQSAVIKSQLAIHNLKKHQVEVELLTQKNELTQERARNQQDIIIALIIAMILFLVLIYVVYLGRRQKIRANKVLVDKNLMIEKQSEQLQQLNDFKNKVFAIVSHDMRSPMQSLFGVVDLISRDLITEAEIKALLPDIKSKMHNMKSLVENLLQWARSSMDGETIMKSDFKVNEVLNEVLESSRHLYSEKGIQIVDHLAPDAVINSDRRLLSIVIRNLIINAIKFSNEQSQIVVSSHDKDDQIGISIKDQGVGMDEEQLSKLFTHEMVNSLGTFGERGSGLGLILCHDFVHKLGGEIWAESEPGKGSTFSFSLPKAS